MDSVIILCAGSGSRSGLDFNKVFYPLGKLSVLDTVISRFSDFERIILVASARDLDKMRADYPHLTVVEGGAMRSDSVRRGLAAAAGSDVVAIHDGARPFVSAAVITAAMDSARKMGSGIPAVASIDHVCLGELSKDGNCDSSAHTDGEKDKSVTIKIGEYLEKNRLYNIQTPQCFRFAEIANAYNRVQGSYADDSQVYKLAGYSPTLTEGDYANKKLTTATDFAGVMPYQALGSGFDVHRLVENRRLILGGVEIPFDKGLLGHSDADVLAHAVADAVLSAAGAADIGVLFPDTDPANLGMDSMLILDNAADVLAGAGLKIQSLSCVIIAQKPKLSGVLPAIKSSLAARLGLTVDCVNISATTTEFLGLVGEGQAIAASAAVLCSRFE